MNSVIDANREKTYFSIDRCPASLEASGLVKLTNFSTDKLRSMEDCGPHKTDNSSFLIKRIFDEILTETRIFTIKSRFGIHPRQSHSIHPSF